MFHIGLRVDGSWVISPDPPMGFAVGNKVFHPFIFLQSFVSDSFVFNFLFVKEIKIFLRVFLAFNSNGKIFPVQFKMAQNSPRHSVKVEGGIGRKFRGCRPVGVVLFLLNFYRLFKELFNIMFIMLSAFPKEQPAPRAFAGPS